MDRVLQSALPLKPIEQRTLWSGKSVNAQVRHTVLLRACIAPRCKRRAVIYAPSFSRSLACERQQCIHQSLTPRPFNSAVLADICFACRPTPLPLNFLRCRAPLSCGWTSCRLRMQRGTQCGTWLCHHQRSLNSEYAHVYVCASWLCVLERTG